MSLLEELAALIKVAITGVRAAVQNLGDRGVICQHGLHNPKNRQGIFLLMKSTTRTFARARHTNPHHII